MDGVLPDKMKTKSKVITIAGCPSLQPNFEILKIIPEKCVKSAAASDLSLGCMGVLQLTPGYAEKEISSETLEKYL